MVLNAFPKKNREGVWMLTPLTPKNYTFPTGQGHSRERKSKSCLSTSIHTPKPSLDSTHTELPIFTIFYNKYSDVILHELARSKNDRVQQDGVCCSRTKHHSTRDLLGHRCAGLQQLSPGTHSRGERRGWWAWPEGPEGPWVSPSGLEGLNH